MTAYHVHPHLRVAVDRGELVAWLPGHVQPQPLSRDEFHLLTTLWHDGDVPAAQASMLARLREMGACTGRPTAPEGSWPEAGSMAGLLATVGPTHEAQGARWLRPSGACLRPGRRGWCAWSAVHRRQLAMDAAMAQSWLDAPSSFMDLSPTDDGPIAVAVRAALAQLGSAGLLVRAAEATRGAPASAIVDAAPVHLRRGDPWEGVQPDGRRPIYFVTHHVDHLPLALGMLRAAIVAHDDGALLNHYLPLPIVSMSVREMQQAYGRFGPGVWLFSDYVWSIDHNLQLSHLVKAVDRRNLTIHGGPSAPKFEDACAAFMQAQPHIDVVVRGAGEKTLVAALEAMAGQPWPDALTRLADVPGLTHFADGAARLKLARTADRPRSNDLETLPSPYLTGMFDHYGGEVTAAVLETNRGCPYSCTFCDWGSATQEKIHRFDLDRVKAEVDWIARHEIRVLWIADANFGIFERDVEIAQHVADCRARWGFPREVVVNYPKNATERIARIVEIFVRAGICSQGIVSIQTTDAATLRVIRRDNIKTRRYDELADIFRRQGLPLSTDLMIGLPGATVSSFKTDLQYYFDDDVGVKAYRTEMLPNSPMADPDYVREHRIRVDRSNFLVSTASYTPADLAEMMAIGSAFDVADGYAVLRYVLRYLQWDHDRCALEVVHRMVTTARDEPSAYPALTWLWRHFPQRRQVLEGWGPLYEEVGRFAVERLGIPAADAGLPVVLRLNESVMPWPGRRFPENEELPFDAVSYFAQRLHRLDGPRMRLEEHPPGRLTVEDPVGICELDFDALEQYDNHQVFYDLPIAVARRRSSPNFVRRAAAPVDVATAA